MINSMTPLNERQELVRLARKEVRRLAQQALHVQDACNLSGVLKSAFDAACSLRMAENNGLGIGTAAVNNHYIMRLFAAKIGDLTGIAIGWPVDAEKDAVLYLQRFDTEGRRTS